MILKSSFMLGLLFVSSVGSATGTFVCRFLGPQGTGAARGHYSADFGAPLITARGQLQTPKGNSVIDFDRTKVSQYWNRDGELRFIAYDESTVGGNLRSYELVVKTLRNATGTNSGSWAIYIGSGAKVLTGRAECFVE